MLNEKKIQYMAMPSKRTMQARALIAKLEKQINKECGMTLMFFEMIATAISDRLAAIDWDAYELYLKQREAVYMKGGATELWKKNNRLISAVKNREDATLFFQSARFKHIAGLIGLDWEYITRLLVEFDRYKRGTPAQLVKNLPVNQKGNVAA